MARKSTPAKGVAPALDDRPPTPRDEVRDPRLLKPYATNARRHPPEQIEALAASYRSFGFVGRILVDEDGEIIAGHGRHEAALFAKLETVPVSVAYGWTDAQKRAFRLVDNKLAEGSEWDEELLGLEVRGLEDDAFDLGDFFSEKELEGLLAEPEPEAPPAAFQAFGEGIETAHQCPKCSYRWSGKSGGKPTE